MKVGRLHGEYYRLSRTSQPPNTGRAADINKRYMTLFFVEISDFAFKFAHQDGQRLMSGILDHAFLRTR